MGWSARITLILLLSAAPLAAQEISSQNLMPEIKALPDKPAPQGNFITRPFYDKKIRILAEVNAGGAVWDDISSRMVINRGGYERNPLMRPFVHNSGALAAESVVEVWAMAYLADWMKHSRHPLLRKTWWLPQTLNLSAKITGGIYNTHLLAR